MPKPSPRSVSHVSVEGSPLSDDDQAKLLDLLARSKCATDSDSAEQFVRSINGAIVAAYQLAPSMSTKGERREWFMKVRRAIAQLLTILGEADDRRDESNPNVETWRSDDLALLDAELCRYFRREDTPNATSASVAALKLLESTCDKQIKMLGRSAKETSAQQHLAVSLAESWMLHFAKKPTVSLSSNRSGSRRSPFIETLGIAISAAERYYPTALDPPSDDALQPSDDALRGYASRAVRRLKKVHK